MNGNADLEKVKEKNLFQP